MLLQLLSAVFLLGIGLSLLTSFVQILRPWWNRLRFEVSYLLFTIKDFQKQLVHLVTVMYSFDVFFFDFTGVNLSPDTH
ncbi:hypothetical protein QR680_017172 [Steinernema hermaphroditum]|uniref:Uncharacterized protein n=1 Tax=Steinernema hermaphroditum TaxID=289476 RepID=A0AA39HFK9_9BILA|nr:hypothetical protein QR680_017172 [Steinernema hermaphroditum]